MTYIHVITILILIILIMKIRIWRLENKKENMIFVSNAVKEIVLNFWSKEFFTDSYYNKELSEHWQRQVSKVRETTHKYGSKDAKKILESIEKYGSYFELRETLHYVVLLCQVEYDRSGIRESSYEWIRINLGDRFDKGNSKKIKVELTGIIKYLELKNVIV